MDATVVTPEEKMNDRVVLSMLRGCERRMDIGEMYRISRLLEKRHALFYMLWDMGLPTFSRDIPTAAVGFHPKDGRFFGYYWNPEFYDSLDDYSRAFIIGHEALHILFNHGLRHKDKDNKDLANIAQDIIINHTLVNGFGFKREQVKDWEKACWVDTIWPDRQDVPDDECFEYYYKLLQEDPGECGKNQGPGTIDIHLDDEDGEGGGDGTPLTMEDLNSGKNIKLKIKPGQGIQVPQDVWEELQRRLNQQLTPNEKKKIKEMLEKHVFNDPCSDQGGKQAGTAALGAWIFVEKVKPKPKPKWETIVRKYVRDVLREQEGMAEQWATRQRNHEDLPESLILPAEKETHDIVVNKAKIDVLFFLDASGSCYNMADRFFKAARSVPAKTFRVHLCSFDCSVYELDINDPKLIGGGGTYFHIMEEHIQQLLKSKKIKRYPDAVFVITDGYGSNVQPAKPERWFWFLTENYRTCIPQKSHVYMLSEFE